MTELNKTDSFFYQLLLIIGGTLQTFVLLTIIANFGWTDTLTIISYIVTAIIYFVISLLWKRKIIG